MRAKIKSWASPDVTQILKEDKKNKEYNQKIYFGWFQNAYL